MHARGMKPKRHSERKRHEIGRSKRLTTRNFLSIRRKDSSTHQQKHTPHMMCPFQRYEPIGSNIRGDENYAVSYAPIRASRLGYVKEVIDIFLWAISWKCSSVPKKNNPKKRFFCSLSLHRLNNRMLHYDVYAISTIVMMLQVYHWRRHDISYALIV